MKITQSPKKNNNCKSSLGQSEKSMSCILLDESKDQGKDVEGSEDLLYELKERASEYTEAESYFSENEMFESQKDAQEKVKKLYEIIDSLSNGKALNPEEIPPKISPEYITRLTPKQRTSKLNKIELQLVIQKSLLVDEIYQIENRKNKKITINEEKKEIIKGKHKQISAVVDQIEYIKQIYNNLWVPVPLFEYGDSEEKILQKNPRVKPNSMLITLGKIDYIKDNLIIEASLDFSNKVRKIVLNQKEPGNIGQTFEWSFEKYEYPYLYLKEITIRIYYNGWLGKSLKGKSTVKLSSLKSQILLKKDYDVELVSKRFVPKINITISLREPFVSKYALTVKKRVKMITKKFPSFLGCIARDKTLTSGYQDTTVTGYEQNHFFAFSPIRNSKIPRQLLEEEEMNLLNISFGCRSKSFSSKELSYVL